MPIIDILFPARLRASMAWALLAVSCFLLWQFATVRYNHGGNGTALFLTGSDFAIPPELQPGTARFPGAGFDGQMYRYVAHDPFMRRGYARYLDEPAQRYSRILVPVLAYLLVAGHAPWIDASYIAVIALFALLGAFWLSRWAVLAGRHPAWAIAFLFVPATLISMDRLTVDIALAAFTVAFALCWRTGSWTTLFVVLILACFVRETGAFLAGGCCLAECFRRRWARGALWASAALPAFAWYLYVHRLFPANTDFGIPHWVLGIGLGLFYRLQEPPQYLLAPRLNLIARAADVLSLATVLLASLLAILFLRAQRLSPLSIAAVLYVALVFLLTNTFYWTDVNGYARVLSPLLLLLALAALRRENGAPWWTGLLPALFIDIRLAMGLAASAGGILRGLFP